MDPPELPIPLPLAPAPVGLTNPRLSACCGDHPEQGKVANFCYQNAVLQCLASLPWTRRMFAQQDTPLAIELWKVLELLCGDNVARVQTRVPDFIVRHGVKVDEQFVDGIVQNCYGQWALPQADAGEFFMRLIDKVYTRPGGGGQQRRNSPFDMTMSVQHFETENKHFRPQTTPTDSVTETHSLLIVEPVARDLNACIVASYDERHDVHVKKFDTRLGFTKTVTVTKSKQANVAMPGPQFLAVYIKRVRGGEMHRSIWRGTTVGPPRKDERAIEIPLVHFQLEGKSSLSYNCTGIVCHAGQTASAGHYVAYVRRGQDWFLCDDDTVTALDRASFTRLNKFQPRAGAPAFRKAPIHSFNQSSIHFRWPYSLCEWIECVLPRARTPTRTTNQSCTLACMTPIHSCVAFFFMPPYSSLVGKAVRCGCCCLFCRPFTARLQ